MANGFTATKNKSETKQVDLITALKAKTTVTNKELAELIIMLLEKLK